MAGIATTGVDAVGYNLFGSVRTNGTTAVLVKTPDKIANEDNNLILADTNLIVSGNTAIVRVLGVLGYTINWGAFAVYVTAT